MKVKIIKPYSDTTMEGKIVNQDTILEVSEERAKVLVAAKVGEIIKEKNKEEKVAITKSSKKDK